MTWPLAANLSSAISDPGDPLGTTWIMDWEYFALTHHHALWDAPIFAPATKTLAFSENILAVTILFFPLFALGVAPLTINNLAMLLGFAASGWAMYLLARWVTKSTPAAIVAGIAYAFVGYRFIHITHVIYVWSPWLPLLLLALLVYAKTPTLTNAALFGGAFLMNGYSCLHWFVFGSVAVALTAIAIGYKRGLRFWLLLGGATAIALLLLAPMLWQYVAVGRMYDLHRYYDELLPNSAEWRDWIVPAYGERKLFPGIVTSVLALIALVTVRRNRDAWPAVVWIVIGALGARGVRGWFGAFLFDHVPGFGGIRMPVRWVMVSYVGIALLAAMAVASLIANRSRATQIAVGALIAAAMLLELRVAPIRWYLMPSEPRPFYAWLRDAPIRGSVVEVPMTQQMAYEYLWHSTTHHRPIVNGVSSNAPPGYDQLVAMFDAPAIPDALLDALEARGCSLIVVHEGALRTHGRELLAFLNRAVDNGRLTFVRRFPAGTRADWVFALTRIEPQATSWRAPEVPDRAGRTPMQNCALFLHGGGWTYNDAIFGMLSERLDGTVRGKLTIRGWCVAPSGIAKVSLRFANGRVVVPGRMLPRDDIASALPWYPKENNGFLNDFDGPPAGARGDTDLQIEIADNTGRTLRLRPQWFRWLPAPREVPQWHEERLRALLQRMQITDPSAEPRIVSGSAAVHDFVGTLEGDVLTESNVEFANRATNILLGPAASRDAMNRVLRAVDSGRTREEAMRRLVASKEFAAYYLRSGRIVLD